MQMYSKSISYTHPCAGATLPSWWFYVHTKWNYMYLWVGDTQLIRRVTRSTIKHTSMKTCNHSWQWNSLLATGVLFQHNTQAHSGVTVIPRKVYTHKHYTWSGQSVDTSSNDQAANGKPHVHTGLELATKQLTDCSSLLITKTLHLICSDLLHVCMYIVCDTWTYSRPYLTSQGSQSVINIYTWQKIKRGPARPGDEASRQAMESFECINVDLPHALDRGRFEDLMPVTSVDTETSVVQTKLMVNQSRIIPTAHAHNEYMQYPSNSMRSADIQRRTTHAIDAFICHSTWW